MFSKKCFTVDTAGEMCAIEDGKKKEIIVFLAYSSKECRRIMRTHTDYRVKMLCILNCFVEEGILSQSTVACYRLQTYIKCRSYVVTVKECIQYLVLLQVGYLYR